MRQLRLRGHAARATNVGIELESLGQVKKVARVTRLHRRVFVAREQLLAGVLANRLEKPEA
jgi:hypothetical protein